MKQVVRITCDTKDLIAPEKLTPLQGELKSLTEKKYEKLKASLLRHGFVFPEYVWKNGKTNYVTDGHQRLRALVMMKQQGIELEGGKVPIVYVHADDKKHAMELILAAMSEYGTYDEDSIYEFVSMAELDWSDVKPFSNFPALNMGKLEKGWFDGDWTVREKEDDVPALPKKSVTKLSDSWALGDHTVICCDAAVAPIANDIPLVVTDPPYNLAGNYSLYAADLGDNAPAMKKLKASAWDIDFDIRPALSKINEVASKDSSVYIHTAHTLAPVIWEWMKTTFAPKSHSSYCVWEKPSAMPSLSQRHWTWVTELICYATRGRHVFNFMEGTHNPNVFHDSKNAKNEHHPTQKPVALVGRMIRASSNEGMRVLDLFMGSGTTVIACEKLGRSAVGAEIDPAYCDVIVERWQEFSGKKAKRIHGKHARPARPKVKS